MDSPVDNLSDLITSSETPNETKIVGKEELTPTHGEKEMSINDDAPQDNEEAKQDDTPVKVSEKRRASILVGHIENEQSPKKSKMNDDAEQPISNEVQVRQQRDVLARTVFVRNLPITTRNHDLMRLFTKYGTIENVGFHQSSARPKTPRKWGVITKNYHANKASRNGYVRFELAEDARKALALNGVVFDGHYLKVFIKCFRGNPDEHKAICVSNLSYNAIENDLWQLFEVCGPIDFVRIMRDMRTGSPKGFGFVNFQNSDAVQRALQMKNVQLYYRKLRISRCFNNNNNNTAKDHNQRNGEFGKQPKTEQLERPSALIRTVSVENLPITMTAEKMMSFFANYGAIKIVKIRVIPMVKKEFVPNSLICDGFITYKLAEDAQKALGANGVLFEDHHLRVFLCHSQDEPDEHKAIFVSNLCYSAKDDELWELFEVCGPIECVRIVRDSKTGCSRHYGYVIFQNSDAVRLALEMENVKLNDQELQISRYNPRWAGDMNRNKTMYKHGNAKPLKNRTDNRRTIQHEVDDRQNISIEVENNTNDQCSTFPDKEGSTFSDKNGCTFPAKKKNKRNKGLMQKKKMIKMVVPNTLS